jgi:hypothetical protein
MGERGSVVGLLGAPGHARLEDLMVRSGAQRRVSNHGPRASVAAYPFAEFKAPTGLSGRRKSSDRPD